MSVTRISLAICVTSKGKRTRTHTGTTVMYSHWIKSGGRAQVD
jgi:hypothetical protein